MGKESTMQNGNLKPGMAAGVIGSLISLLVAGGVFVFQGMNKPDRTEVRDMLVANNAGIQTSLVNISAELQIARNERSGLREEIKELNREFTKMNGDLNRIIGAKP